MIGLSRIKLFLLSQSGGCKNIFTSSRDDECKNGGRRQTGSIFMMFFSYEMDSSRNSTLDGHIIRYMAEKNEGKSSFRITNCIVSFDDYS